MYVDGFVEDFPASLLVDTGSCVTLLNSKFARDLIQVHNVNLIITPSSITLRAVNNSPVPVVGECNVTLSVGNLKVKHQVIIADIGPDVLMGIDFLRFHGCTVDFASKLLYAGDKPTPLRNLDSEKQAVYRLKLAESVTLPPYSQVIVPGKIQCDTSYPVAPGFIDPSKKFLEKYNVAMAGVLVQPDHSGRVPIRLQNFLSRPTTIAKNYDLAEFVGNVEVEEEDADCVSVNACNSAQQEIPPEERHKLFNLQHLAEVDIHRMTDVLTENADIISTGSFDLGKTDVVSHDIVTETKRPKRQPPRRVPLHQRTLSQRTHRPALGGRSHFSVKQSLGYTDSYCSQTRLLHQTVYRLPSVEFNHEERCIPYAQSGRCNRCNGRSAVLLNFGFSVRILAS